MTNPNKISMKSSKIFRSRFYLLLMSSLTLLPHIIFFSLSLSFSLSATQSRCLGLHGRASGSVGWGAYVSRFANSANSGRGVSKWSRQKTAASRFPIPHRTNCYLKNTRTRIRRSNVSINNLSTCKLDGCQTQLGLSVHETLRTKKCHHYSCADFSTKFQLEL